MEQTPSRKALLNHALAFLCGFRPGQADAQPGLTNSENLEAGYPTPALLIPDERSEIRNPTARGNRPPYRQVALYSQLSPRW